MEEPKVCKGCQEVIVGFCTHGYCEDCLCSDCGTELETDAERAAQMCADCEDASDA